MFQESLFDSELQQNDLMCFTIGCKVWNNFSTVIDQREIQKVDVFKYLGVILGSHLNFKTFKTGKISRTIKININCSRCIMQQWSCHRVSEQNDSKSQQ